MKTRPERLKIMYKVSKLRLIDKYNWKKTRKREVTLELEAYVK